ncbi:MAG: branched-chain amino acid ABC transporter permease [Candidatus Rokubacteria bacterium]|nr:branched-chain amino acid ABC transporter permease [Candidatus Rokubacteria bacterium]
MDDPRSDKTAAWVPLALAGLFVFVAAPPFLPRWALFLLTVAWAKALVVLGVVLLLRAGLVSFGHGLYFAAGAYAAGFGVKTLGIQEGVALAAFGLLAGGGLAALLGLLLARYRAIFFALLNLAFSMVLYALLLKFYWITGGSDGIGIRPPALAGVMPSPEALRVAHYYFALVLGSFCSVRHTIYLAYVLAGLLGGRGGALAAFAVGHILPEYAYWTQSGEFVFVAVLGGTGSVIAPVAGSIVFEFARNYAFKLSPYTWQMNLGIVLMLVILFLPGGLWSLSAPLSQRWISWRSRLKR